MLPLRLGRTARCLPGWQALVALLAEHGDQAGEQSPAAIETSRGLLAACLRATGRKVYAINPLAVARYRERHTVARAPWSSPTWISAARNNEFDFFTP